MSAIVILLILVVAVIVTFSKAGECFHCGSREVHKWSTWGTRGLCLKCEAEDKGMED
mgnify:CR=1 FL=1